MTAGQDAELDRPNAARIYDYLLGGEQNFTVDRAAAEHVLDNYPDAALAARANRAFLRRAVAYLAGQGIAQFLDIGSGLPTVGNVHEVARRANPRAHIVYVDNDPVAVRYSRELLAEEGEGARGVAVIEAAGHRAGGDPGAPGARQFFAYLLGAPASSRQAVAGGHIGDANHHGGDRQPAGSRRSQ